MYIIKFIEINKELEGEKITGFKQHRKYTWGNQSIAGVSLKKKGKGKGKIKGSRDWFNADVYVFF